MKNALNLVEYLGLDIEKLICYWHKARKLEKEPL